MFFFKCMLIQIRARLLQSMGFRTEFPTKYKSVDFAEKKMEGIKGADNLNMQNIFQFQPPRLLENKVSPFGVCMHANSLKGGVTQLEPHLACPTIHLLFVRKPAQ